VLVENPFCFRLPIAALPKLLYLHVSKFLEQMAMRSFTLAVLVFQSAIQCLMGQALDKERIEALAIDYLPQAVSEYRKFLSIPNNGQIAEHRDRNVEWCVERFNALGFNTRVVTSDRIPYVLAEKIADPNAETVLFYMQIDGQPVDTAAWFQQSPYIPVLKKLVNGGWQEVGWHVLEEGMDPELRVFARSASDSKGPSLSLISALQILQNQGLRPAYNLKLLMDFQEELSSPTLAPLVKEKPELFHANRMIIMDGTRHLSNLPTLAYGGRGIADITLTVYGSTRNLHSGQYGNFAPNPVFKLARLLGGMKDEYGRVTIPDFYKGVLITDADREVFARIPEDNAVIEESLGIAEAEKVGETYQEAMQYPSLNVRGLRAAWVGEDVRTIIPAEALAEIDVRLVPETDGLRQVELIKKYIGEQGFHVIDSLPTPEERNTYPKLIRFEYQLGSKPFRSDMHSELGHWLRKAMERIFGKAYVELKMNGGSQPIAPFITTLDIPAVSVRIPNPDNNIHAPNENLRLGNLLEGIQSCLAILTQPIHP
jgi:acetylornithine deacetylase/succinyl-diaminopimelate desuccinylase-like protein